MPTTDIWQLERHTVSSGQVRPLPRRAAVYRLSGALALVAAFASALTLFVPAFLTGPPAMNGSARGTALVVLAIAVPVLVWATLAARQGSVRAIVVWLGACGYLLYNAVMFLFGTPLNELFLIYVALLSLSLWSLIAMLARLDLQQLERHFRIDLPARPIAIYLWAVVALNALVWLRGIVSALADGSPAAVLQGTGLTTNPVYVQDLAFWLPLAAVAGVWLWQRRPWGLLLAGSVMTMWVLEALSIAVDQWFGHAADPASPVASATIAWGFLGLALIGCVPLVPYLRNLRDR